MKCNIWEKTWTKLKKFGLNYDDFPTMIENVADLLRILTINIEKSWNKRIPVLFYVLISFFLFGYCYAYIFSIIWSAYCRYGRENVEEAAIVLGVCTCSITCVTKFAFMKVYAENIKNTVDKYLKCNSKVVPNTRFAENLRRNLRVIKRRASIIWIFLASDGLVYMIMPYVTPGRHFSIDQLIIYGLEPMFESPNFEIATFILTSSTCFAVYTMVGIAVYVIVMVGYNEAQIRSLSEELRNVWDDSQNFYNSIKHKISDKKNVLYMKRKIVNEFIRIRLRDIINFHIANVNLLHELDDELRPTLALEYIIMAFSIIAELLGGLENTYLQLPYTIVQVFRDCLAGQRLIDACDDFEKSVYSCQWENFNASNQRTVHMILMMSQKTLVLTAGGITLLNFNCLMVVLKSTYSTYTTLQSTMKKHSQM